MGMELLFGKENTASNFHLQGLISPTPLSLYFFPYLLFNSLQLEIFARSTQNLEKRLMGRDVGLQEVIARFQTERERESGGKK